MVPAWFLIAVMLGGAGIAGREAHEFSTTEKSYPTEAACLHDARDPSKFHTYDGSLFAVTTKGYIGVMCVRGFVRSTE